MILIDNDNPLESIYYISYKFLNIIKRMNFENIDIEKSYELINDELENKIDFSKYLLVIDYLFINNCIELSDKGKLKINVFK